MERDRHAMLVFDVNKAVLKLRHPDRLDSKAAAEEHPLQAVHGQVQHPSATAAREHAQRNRGEQRNQCRLSVIIRL